ncbi:peptidylprolyl isomerase [Lutibacter sp. Hel_I_33_5]|nr:peptidylprolyl isomerase [Lutibacter sp. Hel_I_33_5]
MIQCDDKQKKKKNILLKKEKKVIQKKPVEKAWDSLNKKNVIPFFTEYGKQNKETKVKITTDFGEIKLRLYNDTPIHRANFIFLTKIGYFTHTEFYRIAKNFVIQGGNSEDFGKSKVRYKYRNYVLKPEFRKHRRHTYGVLAAAKETDNNPNNLSNPFEFYIVQSKSGAHHLNNLHTVFGEVISGYSTMEKMSKVKVGPDEWPIEDIKMKVEIID